MGIVSLPHNNYLKQISDELSPIENRINVFCESINFQKYPKPPGRIASIVNSMLKVASIGTIGYCMVRIMTLPSRKYEMGDSDAFLAICAAITSFACLYFRPLNSSEEQLKETFDLWKSFILAYTAHQPKEMMKTIRELRSKQSLFPEVFNQAYVGDGSTVKKLKMFIHKYVSLRIFNQSSDKEFLEIVKYVKAASHIYEIFKPKPPVSSKKVQCLQRWLAEVKAQRDDPKEGIAYIEKDLDVTNFDRYCSYLKSLKHLKKAGFDIGKLRTLFLGYISNNNFPNIFAQDQKNDDASQQGSSPQSSSG